MKQLVDDIRGALMIATLMVFGVLEAENVVRFVMI